MADNHSDSDEVGVLRPLHAAACTYRIAFGPRAGHEVLTLQGAMPRGTECKQALRADMGGNRAARRSALRGRRLAGAETTVALDRPLDTGQRTRADQRCRASGAQAQSSLARRDHAPAQVAAGVHAAPGSPGAQASAASDPLARRAGTLRYNFGQAARAGGAVRA